MGFLHGIDKVGNRLFSRFKNARSEEIMLTTPWAEYTPTVVFSGTDPSKDFKWRRVGDSIEIWGVLNFTNSGSSVNITCSIPPGFTVDIDKQVGVTNGGEHINGPGYHNTGAIVKSCIITAQDSNTICWIKTDSTAIDCIDGNEMANGHVLSCKATIPVVEYR